MGRTTDAFRMAVLCCAALLILSLLAGPAAAGAQSSSMTTTNGRHTVQWSDDWEYDAGNSDTSEDAPIIALSADISSVLFQWVDVGGLSLDTSFTVYHEALTGAFEEDVTTISTWGDDRSRSSLDEVTLSSTRLVMLTRIEMSAGYPGEAAIYVFLAYGPYFASEFGDMQEQVTVDNDMAFAGETEADIQAHLDAGDQQAARPSTPESEGGARSPDESAPVPGAVPGTRGRAAPPTSGEATPAEEPGNDTRQADSVLSFENRSIGYTVEWSGAWQQTRSLQSEDLSLALADNQDIVVTFTGLTFQHGTNRDSLVQSLTTQAGQNRNPTEIAISDDRFLEVETSRTGVQVTEYVFLANGKIVVVTAYLESESLDRSVDSIHASIQLDGDPVLRDWDQLEPVD